MRGVGARASRRVSSRTWPFLELVSAGTTLATWVSMLDLTWWQVFALLGSVVVSVVGGRILGAWGHRALYRRVLLTRSQIEDRLFMRLEAPFGALGVVLVWHVLVSFGDYPASVIAFCRALGHIGLLLALGWAAMRTIDTGMELVAMRSRWITNQRLSQALLPLARRIAKIVLGVLVGVMILSRLGYAVGPLLVLLAIVGAALALASHRPLENVLAAYAILGDHGIREGDTVRLDSGTVGDIEAIGLYSTRIRTGAGSYVIVPNRKLADAQIERSVVRPATVAHAAVPPPSVLTTTSPGGIS
jgi:MscS family membrane protein